MENPYCSCKLTRLAGVSKREAAEMLLACGAGANLAAEDGHTPLMCSMHWENEASLTKLIAAGVDVTARDRNGLTAFDLANKLVQVSRGLRLQPLWRIPTAAVS